MNEPPNIGQSPLGDKTRDPELISAPPKTLPPEAAAPAMPDLSMADGNAGSSRPTAVDPPKLDGYEVLVPIGEGGMGTVWRATQLSTRRNVALKLISAAGFGSDRARQRFDREVEITAKLEHPNIARVYDSGVNRGVYFYAMELIDGVPLDQYVADHHLSRAEILRLFALVCRGVDHAHQRGVIHRDLKPGNILVSADGQPHVLDFGLAKALEQAGKEAGISIDGEVAGTPGFMAPEQAAGKIDLDARCDVYSLGVILYRLLTGQSPHDLSGTYLDILRRVSDEEPRRPRTVDRAMDRDLEALLLHALQRDPAHRYATAGQLAQDVESYVRGDPITAKPPTVLYYARKRAVKHRGKLVIAAFVLLLLGLATVLTNRLIRAHREALLKDAQARAATVADAIDTGQKLIAQGNSDLAGGQWTPAADKFWAGYEKLKSAGASTISAELALWDLARTAPPPLIVIPTSATPNSLVVLRDNVRALAGYEDGTVRLFDLPTGRVLKTIDIDKQPARSLAVSADATVFLMGDDVGSLQLWDLATGALKRKFADPGAPLKNRVTHVALSPNGRLALSVSGATPQLLASTGYHDTVTLWDVASGKALLSSDASTKVFDVDQTITAASFSSDSSKVVTASAHVVVWSVDDGKRIAESLHSATTASFSAQGDSVVIGASDGTLRVLNIADDRTEEIAEVGGRAGRAISAGGFDSAGRIVAVSEDGACRCVDRTGRLVWRQPGRGEFDSAELSADASLAITASDGGLSVWRMRPPAEMQTLATRSFSRVSIAGDGHDVAAIHNQEPAVLFDAVTGKETFMAAGSHVIAMSRDGRTVATDSPLAVVSLDPPHPIRALVGSLPAGPVRDAVISDDGSQLAVAVNNLAYVSGGANRPPLQLTGHAATITGLAISADGRILLTGSEDQTARLWDPDSGALLAILRGHSAPVNAVALTPDGKLAITASGQTAFQGGTDHSDNSVRVWEVPSGRPIAVLQSHAARVNTVAVSADGQLIASGGDDQTVVLWDGTNFQPVRTIQSPYGSVLSLAMDRRGRHLVCGSSGSLNEWNLELPVKKRDMEPAVSALLASVSAKPLGADDYVVLGRWYTLQDEPIWAEACLRLAQSHR